MKRLVKYFSEDKILHNTLTITGSGPLPFQVTAGVLTRPDMLCCNHEEGDVIIVQHAVYFFTIGVTPITVLSEDTGVFVLLMHYHSSLNLASDLRMGHMTPSPKVISINRSAEECKEVLARLLEAHALSG